jgi:hypothetical protein
MSRVARIAAMIPPACNRKPDGHGQEAADRRLKIQPSTELVHPSIDLEQIA